MADYDITNELVTPSANDINGGVAGDGVNAFEKFVAPWRAGMERSHVVSGFVIPASSGNLNISIPLGVAIISGYRVNVPGSTTLTFTDAQTNYVFLKLTRDGSNNVNAAKFEVNITGTAPADSVMIGIGIAAGSAITNAWEARQLLPLGLPGLQPPSSVGSGSSRSHEGDGIITSNGNYSGVHYYRSFWLKSGITMTITSGEHSLVIISETAITIEGTIMGSGAGGAGGYGGGGGGSVPGGCPQIPGGPGSPGEPCTDQPGGNGGGGSGGLSWVQIHGAVVHNSGSQHTASKLARMAQEPDRAVGGSGGGGGQGGTGGSGCPGQPGGSGGPGGNGGASIVLIAPIVILKSSATLNTSGSNGAPGNPGIGNGSPGSVGGGGGAGNVYIQCRSFTDSGATFTQTGGGTGPAGQAGLKQVNLYG